MATILCIETSTSVCSASLAIDGKLVAMQESTQANVHSEKLAVFINMVMDQAGLGFSKLDAAAIGTGPGSYTGLRIGTATAKGLCYAMNKPLIAVPTLKAMAMAAASLAPYRGLGAEIIYCPMIDARRLEVYTALYDYEGLDLLDVNAMILDKNSFSEFLEKKSIVFFGDGMPKMKKLSEPNDTKKIWMDDIYASSANLISLAEQAYSAKQFADVAYYEPYYLKDFVAKKKLVP